MLIAIDTATRYAGIALFNPAKNQILGEETWYSVNNHTVQLMPRMDRMLEQQGVSVSDLTGIAVSLGPGSFTGLRIGMGVAKGLAMARKIGLVGVPTLDVVARPHMAQPLPIWAILQAGRRRICVANYAERKGRWRVQGEYQLTTVEELCEQEFEPCLFCGELEADDAELIRQRLGPTITIASPASSLRRAGHMAELAWQRLGRGDSDDPASLSPIYLQTL
jgi:tRNA threonylcarbamoyladenosine biosynthesis protein TsaB